MNIPKDPIMLLSYINTQLRDFYPSLKDLCYDKGLNIGDITEKMKAINYKYDKQLNKFV